MAAASCVQEEKEDKEVQEPSDAIAQGNSRRARIHLVSYVRCAHTCAHLHKQEQTLIFIPCTIHSVC